MRRSGAAWRWDAVIGSAVEVCADAEDVVLKVLDISGVASRCVETRGQRKADCSGIQAMAGHVFERAAICLEGGNLTGLYARWRSGDDVVDCEAGVVAVLGNGNSRGEEQ